MNSLESYLSYVVHGRHATRKRAPKRWKRAPARSAAYLSWVRTLPCLICGAHAEAAHTGSDGGLRLKASDFSAVPLCHRCHRTGKRAYHQIGKRVFEALHLISFEAITQRLNAEWARRSGK